MSNIKCLLYGGGRISTSPSFMNTFSRSVSRFKGTDQHRTTTSCLLTSNVDDASSLTTTPPEMISATSPSSHLKFHRFLSTKVDLSCPSSSCNSPVSSWVTHLQHILDHDNHELREKYRKLFNTPLFAPRPNITLDEERQLTLDRLQAVCDAGLISVRDFQKDPLRIFAAHEMAIIDPAMGTKMTVQFNLFGGTMLKLGSERHNSIVDGIDSLKDIGCFGLTELGYGNNAVRMETTAHYDAKTDSLIINSPSTLSQKYWITNGACHAKHIVVFAQLHMGVGEDAKHEGIHAVLVRCRDDNLKPMEGVTIEDMGHKIGLNGVDNAKLTFKDVKVPRTNLLNKYSDIDEHGKFTSKVSVNRSVRARFLAIADQLLSGRICIASGCIMSSKIALSFGVRSLLASGNVASLKQEMMPLLAETYAMAFNLNRVKRDWMEMTNMGDAVPSQKKNEVIAAICATKATSSWHLNKVTNASLIAGGFHALLSKHYFGEMFASAHAGMTAEGDNCVLMQKTAQILLGSSKTLIDLSVGTTFKDKDHVITSRRQLENLLNARCANMRIGVQKQLTPAFLIDKLKSLVPKFVANLLPTDSWDYASTFNVWMNRSQYQIQELSKAYGNQLIADSFGKAIKDLACNDASSSLETFDQQELLEILEEVYHLYLLVTVKDDLHYYLKKDLISVEEAQQIQETTRNLCNSLSRHVQPLIKAFGLPDAVNQPIKQSDVSSHQTIFDDSDQQFSLSMQNS